MRGVVQSVLLALLISVACLPSVRWALAADAGRLRVAEEKPPKADGKKKKKKKKKKAHLYKYKVQKGDSLSEIAEQFGVSVKQLKGWNRRATRDARHLSVGTTLRIYANMPVRSKRRNYYVVKKGDSLKRIAAELNTTVDALRRLNGLKGSLIRPGQKLAFLVPGPDKKSESVGRPSSGRLVNGEQLPKGPGYTSGRRTSIYATNETVTMLIKCIGMFRKKHPSGPLVIVGNLSQKGGGKFGPHASHQSGRDVDLGYIHKKKFQPVSTLQRTSAETIDAKRTWDLLQCFLDTRKVKYIFMARSLQKVLYDHLKARKFSKRFLKKTFQYPLKKGGGAVIQHSKGHRDHFHLRFVCPTGDRRCRD